MRTIDANFVDHESVILVYLLTGFADQWFAKHRPDAPVRDIDRSRVGWVREIAPAEMTPTINAMLDSGLRVIFEGEGEMIREDDDGPTLTIEAFVERLTSEAKRDPTFNKDGARGRVQAPQYEIDKGGRKYKRIVTVSFGQRSAWGFIEIESGDIYKPAGWNGPAKHVRGNIATGVYGKHYNHFGPRYLC